MMFTGAGGPSAGRRLRAYARRTTGLAVLCIAFFGVAAAAQASHGRYFDISWTKTSATSADFTYTAAFRRDGYPGTAPDGLAAPGDVIVETIGATSLDFGDGTTTPGTLSFKVVSINVAQNYLVGVALDPGSTTDTTIHHTYPGSGPFTAVSETCCTIGALNNNSNGTYATRSLVDLSAGSNSPKTSLPPIVSVGDTGTQQFLVTATTPPGETLRYRLATPAEACGGAAGCQPPGFSVDPTTGLVTWDTTGLTSGLWFASIVIEGLDRTGTVVSSTQATFLLNIVSQAQNQIPVFGPPSPPDGATLCAAPGVTFTYPVSASDPDAGQTVTLSSQSLPANASFTQTPGNPATGAIAFTPDASQLGQSFLVTLIAQDDGAPPAAASATYTLTVTSECTPPAPAPSGPAAAGATTTTAAPPAAPAPPAPAEATSLTPVTTPAPTTTVPSRTPRIRVLSARLSGAPSRGCISASTVAVRASVRGKRSGFRVTVRLDGKVIARSAKRNFTVRVPVARLEAGRHRLVVRASGPNARTSTRSYVLRKCSAVSPTFTG